MEGFFDVSLFRGFDLCEQATRAKRDAALALLIKRLKMKKAEHAHAESLDVKDTIPTKTIASGAKLGFEYEIATALVSEFCMAKITTR